MNAEEFALSLRWPDRFPKFVALMVSEGYEVEEVLGKPWNWAEEWNAFQEDMKVCLHCDGGGKHICRMCDGNGGPPDDRNACSQCKGTGEVLCEHCGGSGKVKL